MTLRNSPLAIDGALIDSATLRIQAYANASGNDGIINKGDLRVSQLEVAGQGLQVAHGGAVVLNRYQDPDSIDQAYVVSNVNSATLDSSQMPAAAGAQRYHLVCVTVGDPEFSQVGHPWMPSLVPGGEEQTFQYVRFHVIQNVPGSVRTEQGLRDYMDTLTYPALPLAVLDVPANTTAITDAMITDVRYMANPRSLERVEHLAAGGTNGLQGVNGVAGTWEDWPASANFDLYVPKWAVRAKLDGFVEGLEHRKAGQGAIRFDIEGVGSTSWTQINEPAPGGSDRRGYNLGGDIFIPAAARGTTVRVRMRGMASNDTSQGFLYTTPATSVLFRVRLDEEAS